MGVVRELVDKIQTELSNGLGGGWQVTVYSAENLSFQFRCYHIASDRMVLSSCYDIRPFTVETEVDLIKAHLEYILNYI